MAERKVRRRRRVRWPFYLLGFFAFVAAAAAIVYDPLLRHVVREQALANGVELRCHDVRYRLGTLSLRACQARLVGVGALELRAASIVVDLDRTEPLAARVQGVDLDLAGPAPALWSSISAWAARYPRVVSVPLEAEDVRLAWHGAADAVDVSAAIDTASLEGALHRARARFGRFAVAGLELGPLDTGWDGDRANVDLALGSAKLSPPLRLSLELGAKTRASLAIERIALARLAAPFGVAIPIDALTVAGRASLDFTDLEGEAAGALEASFDGWLPPHPAEIDPFLAGKPPALATNLLLAADRRSLALRDTTVAIGAITLKGGGNVRRDREHALLTLSLRSSLSCAELGNVLARLRLGGELGALAGTLIATGVAGSVSFGVDLEASSADVAGAKLTPVVALGCGIKSLDRLLPDLARTLPAVLPKVELPPLELPHLPFPR